MTKKIVSNRVVLMGGLGNQLFQYAYALRLSRITKSKVFLSPNLATVRKDEHGNPEISNYMLNPSIILEPHRNSPKIIKRFVGTGLRLSSSPSLSLGNLVSRFLVIFNKVFLSLYFNESVTLNFSRNTGYWNSRSENPSSFNLGYFQSYKYSEARDDIQALRNLTPRSEYPEQNSLSQMAKIELPLIVHVRLADYKTENNFGIPSKRYYEKAITFQINSGLYKKIWLFSDEPDEAIQFIPNIYLDLVRCISKEITDPIWC